VHDRASLERRVPIVLLATLPSIMQPGARETGSPGVADAGSPRHGGELWGGAV